MGNLHTEFPLHSEDAIRTPPAVPEAEAALVVGLMADPSAWDRVADLVYAKDFYRRDCRAVFTVIEQLAAKNAPFDRVAVAEAMSAAKLMDDVGGKVGFVAVVTSPGSSANARHYAELIANAARSRGLIAACAKGMESAYSLSPDEVAAELAVQLDNVSLGHAPNGGWKGPKPLLNKLIEEIEGRHSGNHRRECIPTGLKDLNKALGGGFEAGQLVILAARPAMGKSSLAVGIAYQAAASKGPVAFFSLEMPGSSIWERLLAAKASISLHKVRTDSDQIGLPDADEWPRLTSSVNLMAQVPLYVDDTATLTMTALKARARRLKREHGSLAMIVLDYLQLLTPEGRSENRTQEVSIMTRQLKILAMEMGCPVLCLSQLNRGLENRTNKRPTLADLRESGSIEQDSDIVMFIYRDEVYHENSTEKGVAEIIIGKNRQGPNSTVRSAWLGECARFSDLAYDWQPPSPAQKPRPRRGSQDYEY